VSSGRLVGPLLIAAVIGCRSRPAMPPSGASGLGPQASGEIAGLSFAPAIVEIEAPRSQRRSRDARLAGRLAPRAHLSVEQVEDSALDVQLLPPDGSGAPGLRLGFVGDRAGVRTGQVVVGTGLDEPARLTLLYSLRVPSNVTVTPSNPVLDLRDPAGRERRLEVRGRDPDFRVTAVAILSGPFRGILESDGDTTGGVASIRLRVDEAAIGASTQRGFVGKLRIGSNDPDQPTADVPLFAMGALPPHPPSPPLSSDAADHGSQGRK